MKKMKSNLFNSGLASAALFPRKASHTVFNHQCIVSALRLINSLSYSSVEKFRNNVSRNTGKRWRCENKHLEWISLFVVDVADIYTVICHRLSIVCPCILLLFMIFSTLPLPVSSAEFRLPRFAHSLFFDIIIFYIGGLCHVDHAHHFGTSPSFTAHTSIERSNLFQNEVFSSIFRYDIKPGSTPLSSLICSSSSSPSVLTITESLIQKLLKHLPKTKMSSRLSIFLFFFSIRLHPFPLFSTTRTVRYTCRYRIEINEGRRRLNHLEQETNLQKKTKHPYHSPILSLFHRFA